MVLTMSAAAQERKDCRMGTESPAGKDAAAVVEEFFAAEMRYIAAGGAARGADFGEMAALLHPEAVMHQGPSVPWPGDWRGIARLEEFFALLSETWSAMDITNVQHYRGVEGVAVSVVGKLTSRATGLTVHAEASHFITLRDGLIDDWTVFFLDPVTLSRTCGL